MTNNGTNVNHEKDASHSSHSSHPADPLLPPRGDYQTLLSFQKAYQTNYLIDQQIRRLEKDFLEQGGLRERMTRARLQYRSTHPRP